MSGVAGCGRRARVVWAAGALAAMACDVAAFPVCELSVVGQQCILNIDVGGRGTGPYDLVVSSFGSSIIDGSTVTFDFFDELSAAGPVAVSVGPTGPSNLSAWPAPGAALWDDGRASLRITLDSGSVTYNFIDAFYIDVTGTRYSTTFVPNSVPAPPTISLLALAAMAAVAARSRRAQALATRFGGATARGQVPL